MAKKRNGNGFLFIGVTALLAMTVGYVGGSYIGIDTVSDMMTGLSSKVALEQISASTQVKNSSKELASSSKKLETTLKAVDTKIQDKKALVEKADTVKDPVKKAAIQKEVSKKDAEIKTLKDSAERKAVDVAKKETNVKQAVDKLSKAEETRKETIVKAQTKIAVK